MPLNAGMGMLGGAGGAIDNPDMRRPPMQYGGQPAQQYGGTPQLQPLGQPRPMGMPQGQSMGMPMRQPQGLSMGQPQGQAASSMSSYPSLMAAYGQSLQGAGQRPEGGWMPAPGGSMPGGGPSPAAGGGSPYPTAPGGSWGGMPGNPSRQQWNPSGNAITSDVLYGRATPGYTPQTGERAAQPSTPAASTGDGGVNAFRPQPPQMGGQSGPGISAWGAPASPGAGQMGGSPQMGQPPAGRPNPFMQSPQQQGGAGGSPTPFGGSHPGGQPPMGQATPQGGAMTSAGTSSPTPPQNYQQQLAAASLNSLNEAKNPSPGGAAAPAGAMAAPGSKYGPSDFVPTYGAGANFWQANAGSMNLGNSADPSTWTVKSNNGANVPIAQAMQGGYTPDWAGLGMPNMIGWKPGQPMPADLPGSAAPEVPTGPGLPIWGSSIQGIHSAPRGAQAPSYGYAATGQAADPNHIDRSQMRPQSAGWAQSTNNQIGPKFPYSSENPEGYKI